MFQILTSQSVNWGSWFSVVKFSFAVPVSWSPDGLIRSVSIHGLVISDSEWPANGLWFGGVFHPCP